MNPIQNILKHSPLLVLDGALATELERHGCDLNNSLWSAKVLLENPELITTVHTDYLNAGANCIISSSYQASVEGFCKTGLSRDQALELLKLSVRLAVDARNRFWQGVNLGVKPLVAASVGPYGAYLADGSEYRGDYTISEQELFAFHKERLEVFLKESPDILACETLPCFWEAKLLVELVREYENTYCWVSFSAKDGKHINSGEKIRDCATWLNTYEQVAAVGVNCTAPEHIPSLIAEIRQGTDKPIVVYPNSGEYFDIQNKSWHGHSLTSLYGEQAREWFADGAKIIGGCCRTTPQDIKSIATWAESIRVDNKTR